MARGKLRIYLGAAPGVGKTFAMLDEGWRRRSRGTDVAVGFVEVHGRARTLAQVRDLPVVPRHSLSYRGQSLEEMDVDAILARRPAVALVDELAHTNVPGSRNEKRWQDINELLDAGIDVISTVNIQHLASVNDVVQRITGVVQRETVPDAVVRAADQIELVDMAPEALRRRMAHGNIYPPERIDTALANYFRVGNLGALRELALLWVADRVDEELAAYRERHDISAPWETKERIVVALSGAPGGENLLRRAARMAARSNGEVIGVHVRASDGLLRPEPVGLEGQRRLLGELDGRYAEVSGVDEAQTLVAFARAENATQLIMGASSRSRLNELLHGSVINRVIRAASPIDVHVISSTEQVEAGLPALPRRHRPAAVVPRRRNIALALGTAGIALLAAALSPLHGSLALPGALLVLLLGVVVVAVVGGVMPAVVATLVAVVAADYFFTPPIHSLRIAHPADIVALVVFCAVAGVVAQLVDRLNRRSAQVTRARAETESLARLAGRSVLSGADALPDIVSELRRTFALDSVAILAPEGTAWRPVASAGASPPPSPGQADFSADLDEGSVLVLRGPALSPEDTRLLNAFVGQLRTTQERLVLESEAAQAVELAEANSLRSALLAAVSHDLRTPLASIKAAVTSLTSSEVEWSQEDVRGFCKTIEEETDRLTGLVGNLLDMGRLQTGSLPVTLVTVSVEEVLERALASLSTAASGVTTNFLGPLPDIVADPGLLERALANVIANAQKWSPPASTARIEVGVVGDRLDIRVIDSGPGIARERREQVFQPFQQFGDQARDGLRGVGLGLAVAKGFTEAMGGTLEIEDTPGGGTTMVLSLPVVQESVRG
ncbi:MAG TPA: ATP-binding protein [Acidimicrobiales bacterium]|nr:ATP-binding protein [Acidimicrobiales bacterium]